MEGDPEVENVAKTTAPAVVVPTGGKDVTQALFFGGCRVYEAFRVLTHYQQAEIGYDLLNLPYALYTWDITTLKGQGPNGTICTAGCGINSGQSQYLVTVKDGAGSFEVYPADCINYFLFGEIMSDVYFSYRYIQASYSKGIPAGRTLIRM